MSEMKNDLIERYLYDVVRRLPEKQKKDIEEELRTLIEDMVEERQTDELSYDKDIESVLEELGEPAKLAAKYRGEDSHLIGEAYYPLYCQILKIVLLCVGVGMAVSAVVSFFVAADVNSMDGVIRSVQDGLMNLAMIPSALIQAFGWVTFAFFIMERNQVKLQGNKEPWKVSKLPDIPSKKAVIAKSDSILGIVFGSLFAVWFIYAPEYMGAWIKSTSGEMVAISIFNMANWNRILPLFLIIFGLGIIDDLVKLIIGKYNRTVMWVTVICNIISIGLTVYLFKGLVLWNPYFLNKLMSVTGEKIPGDFDVLRFWNTEAGGSMLLSDIFMAVVIFASLLELGVTVYRTLRYDTKQR